MFAKRPKVASVCATVRNRLQPSATVRNRPRVRRKALLNCECNWRGLESESSGLVTSQLYRRFCVAAVILAFAEEASV